MSEQLPSAFRYNLPVAHESCDCDDCKPTKTKRAAENAIAPFRMNVKRDSIGPRSIIEIHDWVVFSNPSDTFNRKRNDEYHSILDLADETIEKIFEYSKDIPSVVCLALSCKRTFKIFDASKNRRDENRRWNNTSGPWKQQLMLLLARGWIPWWRTKLCYACWRFVPYGSKSKDRWLWLERLELCQKKKEQWKANWEVQLWLGGTQQDRKDTRDFRIRCPMCVLYDQALRLPGESMVQKICEGPQLLSLGDRQVQQEREEEKARRRKAWGEKLVKHSKNVGKKNGSKKLSPWAMEPRK